MGATINHREAYPLATIPIPCRKAQACMRPHGPTCKAVTAQRLPPLCSIGLWLLTAAPHRRIFGRAGALNGRATAPCKHLHLYELRMTNSNYEYTANPLFAQATVRWSCGSCLLGFLLSEGLMSRTSTLSDKGGSCSWILSPLTLCSVCRRGATCITTAAPSAPCSADAWAAMSSQCLTLCPCQSALQDDASHIAWLLEAVLSQRARPRQHGDLAASR